MRAKFFAFFLGSLLVVVAGCKKQEAISSFDSNKSDVCGLITKEEIQAIQGSLIKETKGSVSSDGAFRVSQCFYTATDFAKSVSLSVTQSDPNSSAKRSPKDFWTESFGRYEGEEKERDKEERDRDKKEADRKPARGQEDNEERTPPKKISGIGEGAYWTGSSMTGALYVLDKNVLIRISVGGPDNEETKIDKSKALAKKVLQRL
jgi:hypothetical protein